jgi:hypothetical protein
MPVEQLIASETVIVTAPDGVRQQVVVGLPVPEHLLVEYRDALGKDTGPKDAPENLVLAGLSGEDLVKLLRDAKPSAEKILAAVGADRELAAAVIEAEGASRDKPRSTLVASLKAIAEGD